MVDHVIQTHQLHYAFGEREVLHHLSLQVPPGSIFGFLGPNGSGKTTTIRLLLGLLQARQARIQLFGKDIGHHRLEILSKVGALIESPCLYPHLSGRDNLEITRRARQADHKQLGRVLELVQLAGEADRKVREYSLGMRQRLGIALALLNNPDLLILDEPTNGLDPAGIRQIRDLLVGLSQQQGKTIFVSSHLLGEMEKMATHLAILHQGHLVFQGTMAQLRHLQSPVLWIETDDRPAAGEVLKRAHYRLVATPTEQLAVAIDDREQIGHINRLLTERGLTIYGLHTHQQSLEELFLTLTNQQ